MSDEEIQLEGFQAQNIGTRDLDPSMFSALGRLQSPDAPADPEPAATPEASSAPGARFGCIIVSFVTRRLHFLLLLVNVFFPEEWAFYCHLETC